MVKAKTKIDWADYSLNPIKGLCQHKCLYCYAIKMYHRFKWNPEIRLDMSVFKDCDHMKPSSKIFLCSTHDICGSWIPDEWIERILKKVAEYPTLIFIILTKVPERLFGYSLTNNIWLGTTVESQKQVGRIETLLLVNAKTRFVSFEPLQSEIDCSFVNINTRQKIDWMIIGAETGNRKERIKPSPEWINRLLWEHADTPVFMKDNLFKCYKEDMFQEFPETNDNK